MRFYEPHLNTEIQTAAAKSNRQVEKISYKHREKHMLKPF